MRTSARRDASVLMMEDPEQPPSTGPPATLGSARDPRALPVEPGPVESGRVEVGVAAQVRAPAAGDRAALVRFAEGALDALGRSSAELSVLLCDDGFMRDLNLRFRGIDAPTDVLSFEQDLTVGCGSIPGDSILGDSILGDVVISLDTARRQARRRNLSEATEIRELLLHGILHLLGRDHGDGDIADEPMLQEQRRLLESLPWASCAAS